MQTRLMSQENNELDFAGLKDPPYARTAIKELKVRGRSPAGTTCADSTGAGGEVTDTEMEDSKMQFLPASTLAFERVLDDQLNKDVQSTHNVENELAEGDIPGEEIKYAYQKAQELRASSSLKAVWPKAASHLHALLGWTQALMLNDCLLPAPPMWLQFP